MTAGRLSSERLSCKNTAGVLPPGQALPEAQPLPGLAVQVDRDAPQPAQAAQPQNVVQMDVADQNVKPPKGSPAAEQAGQAGSRVKTHGPARMLQRDARRVSAVLHKLTLRRGEAAAHPPDCNFCAHVS